MVSEKIIKEIEKLREEIRRADHRYYVLSDPEISDKAYDDLMHRLQELETEFPELVVPDSPTQRVSGVALEGFATVKHKEKMLSLDNTYSMEELSDWEAKIKRMLKNVDHIDYVVEPKIDGVSCSLLYEKGLLRLGATRGDGETGEDVTANIKTIKSIPLKLQGDFPEIIEVRGEIYMNKDEFQKINKQRSGGDEPVFANPRNATSGSLKLLDTAQVSRRKLRCLVHSFGRAKGIHFETHKQFLDKISSWGLGVDSHSRWCKNLEAAKVVCREWETKRESLPYEIDGMVVKVDRLALREELGTTLKSPRWAVAFKFPAHQATTRIRSVEFGVGRTGIITPVANLEPVECGGVTISRVTLHNFDEIKLLDVRQADMVLVERAGEVIPKIIKVITSRRTGKEKKITIPKRCPKCGQAVAKEKAEEVYWYCLNPDCPAQLARSLLHFASRKAMDIEGMGESLVKELVDRAMVRGLAGIYRLTKQGLLTLPLFKDKKADNLLSALAQSRRRGLSRFLYGLGIRHVGEKAALTLSNQFKTIDAFFSLTAEELEKIPEIGPVVAASVVGFFASRKTRALIAAMKQNGLTLVQEKRLTRTGVFSGKTFVFTGELESLSRSQAQELVLERGGRSLSSVSPKTDFVVVGKNPGSKHAKARTFGVKTLSEKEFLRLIR